MENKLNCQIINQIFNKISTKDELAEHFNISIKTVENRCKQLSEIIEYSKKIGGYRFKSLLPSSVTSNILISQVFNEIENNRFREDISSIIHQLLIDDDKIFYTDSLSELYKTIIMLQIAINHNIVLKFNYQAASKQIEKKYVRPTQIIISNNKRYLYGVYDQKNKVNEGEERSFELNSISNIEISEYMKNANFKTSFEGNSFGKFSNKQFTYLTFYNEAANFIKREKIRSMNFDFIDESFDGKSINIKYYYTSEKEIVRLIQSWMPNIEFTEDSVLSKKILEIIHNNCSKIYKKGLKKQLHGLDINEAIKKEFGSLNFTIHMKDKESLDSCIRNAFLEMLEENELTTKKQIENALQHIRTNFEEIKELYNKRTIVQDNWNMVKEYIRRSFYN